MDISNFIRKVEEDTTNTKKYITRRFHIFYEGKVTERELLEKFIIELEEAQKVIKLIEIKLIYPETTNQNTIRKVLDEGLYEDVKGRTNYIEEDDYVLHVRDFDIFFDYRFGLSTRNSTRVQTDIETFNTFVNEISNEYSDYNFFIVPSFPSIEYAIALGLDSGIDKISCSNSILKEDIFTYFEEVSGSCISRNKKKFNNLFYSNDIFKFKNLNKNSIDDKINKNLNLDIREFMSKLSEGVESIVNKSKSFTYFDQISFLIKEFLEYHL